MILGLQLVSQWINEISTSKLENTCCDGGIVPSADTKVLLTLCEDSLLAVCLDLLQGHFRICPVLPASDYKSDVSVNKHPVYCNDLEM